MNKSRRLFIQRITLGSLLLTGAGILLKPFAAFAKQNRRAFSAEIEAEALAKFFPDQTFTESDAIEIKVHDIVENGAFVPVRISSDLPATESITILVEKNPNPLIASFNLAPDCESFIATRIKMAESSDIVAVVKSKGKLFTRRKFVEIIEGGCD